MTEIRIRNVEEWVVAFHRQQAKLSGNTLEQELRDLLRHHAMERKKSIAAEMRSDLAEMRSKYGVFPDSSSLIREERDARG